MAWKRTLYMTNIPSPAFKSETGFAALVVDFSRLALVPEITIDQKRYVLKDEFHVTLVGSGHKFCDKLAEAKSISAQEARRISIDLFLEAAQQIDFEINLMPAYFKVYKRCRKHQHCSRRSIVVTCTVRNGHEFYKKLTRFSGVPFSMVPHHVTLYTLPDEMSRRGIGLVNMTQFLRHTLKIQKSRHLDLLPRF